MVLKVPGLHNFTPCFQHDTLIGTYKEAALEHFSAFRSNAELTQDGGIHSTSDWLLFKLIPMFVD